MSTITIGIDPHKGSHTAVAIDAEEVIIDKLQVSASTSQTVELLGWAARFEQRRWAVESAAGLGYLLSQQLVAAGETVLDVPPMRAARVRVLGSGRSQKNDPNDARSIAIAALRADDLTTAAEELAFMVIELITNPYMNAEVIRADGGIRMPPK